MSKGDMGNLTKGAGYDEFGNPTAKAFDLGGVDDERLRGEKILFCVAYTQEDVLTCARTLVQPAVASRNLAMDVVTPPEFKAILSAQRKQKSRLPSYSQVWYLSDCNSHLDRDEVRVIQEFNRAGNGVFIWADNDPYYTDANALASSLAGTNFSGNMLADDVLEPSRILRPGAFVEHALTSGLNSLYEGITICSISTAPGVTILGQSHDGQNCMGCFERENRRVVLDTGFTKIAGADRFHRTAGTARYVRNVAFWLARGARDSKYTLLTTPERLATVHNGKWSEEFGYRLAETSPLLFLLAWQDSSDLRIDIKDPTGQSRSASNRQSPIRLEIPAAQPGLWRCRIYGQQTGAGGCSYVLTVVQRGHQGNQPAGRALVLDSHPIPKAVFHAEFSAGQHVIELRKTAFQIRASVERQSDGSLRVRIDRGAEIRVQEPATKRWTVHNREAVVAMGSILFDPEGKSPALITEK